MVAPATGGIAQIDAMRAATILIWGLIALIVTYIPLQWFYYTKKANTFYSIGLIGMLLIFSGCSNEPDLFNFKPNINNCLDAI